MTNFVVVCYVFIKICKEITSKKKEPWLLIKKKAIER